MKLMRVSLGTVTGIETWAGVFIEGTLAQLRKSALWREAAIWRAAPASLTGAILSRSTSVRCARGNSWLLLRSVSRFPSKQISLNLLRRGSSRQSVPVRAWEVLSPSCACAQRSEGRALNTFPLSFERCAELFVKDQQ